MTRSVVIILLLWGIAGYADSVNFKTIDHNSNLNVDTNEHRIWTSSCSVAYKNKGSEVYAQLPPKLEKYVRQFDEDQDGILSNREYRRFQVDSKKIFQAAEDLIMKEFDVNKNRRLDKEEKEKARQKVGKFLLFTFNLTIKKNEDGSYNLRRKRSVTDIYD